MTRAEHNRDKVAEPTSAVMVDPDEDAAPDQPGAPDSQINARSERRAAPGSLMSLKIRRRTPQARKQPLEPRPRAR
ncbi:MAG: hypothetical protein D6826_11200, partial [Alphaproteobacteria bacterium]